MADPIQVRVRLEPPINVVVSPANHTGLQVPVQDAGRVTVGIAEKGPKGDTGPQGPGSILAPATTTTLGGVIIGDNLSINANGLLSAQAVGNYFPLANGITSGVANVPTVVSQGVYSSPNTTRSIYGISKSYAIGSAQYQQYSGVSNITGTTGTALVVGSRYYDPNSTASSAWRQNDLDVSGAINLRSTIRYANGTPYRDMGFGTTFGGMLLYYTDQFSQCSIGASTAGVFIQGKSTVELPPGVTANTPAGINPLQIMNKDTCDKLYAPFQKLN